MLERVHDHARHPRQHAVDDKAWRIVDEDRPLAQLFGDVPDGREGNVIRLRGAHDLEQWHQCDGIEEVHAGNPFGSAQVRGHVGDRKGRGVRREHTVVAHHQLQLREYLLLHLELLEHRLEHDIAVCEIRVVRAAGDEHPTIPREDKGTHSTAVPDEPPQLLPGEPIDHAHSANAVAPGQ